MSQPTLSTVVLSAVLPAGAVAAVPLPPGMPDWMQWAAFVFTMCAAPAGTLLAKQVAPRFLAGRRAKKLSLAAAKERRAKENDERALRLLADSIRENDSEAAALHKAADKLRDEADAERAAADELEAISKPFTIPKE